MCLTELYVLLSMDGILLAAVEASGGELRFASCFTSVSDDLEQRSDRLFRRKQRS